MILSDILVQFGKFVSIGSSSGINWIDILFRFFGLLAAIGIPLFVFYRKNRLDKEKEDEKWEDNNNNDLLYFECLLEDVLIDMKLQIANYETYVVDSKAKPLSLQRLNLVNIENLNRILNKFDHNRLFHAFIDGNEGDVNTLIKKFMRIFKHLERYNMTYSKRVDDLKEHQNNLIKNLTKYRNIVDVTLAENIGKLVKKLLPSTIQGQSDLITKLMDCYKSYGDIPNEEKNHEHRIKFVKEIETILVHSINLATIEKDEILINCRDAKNIYTLAVRRSKFVTEQFEESITKTKESHQVLTSLYNELVAV